jgi:hypothetical protein
MNHRQGAVPGEFTQQRLGIHSDDDRAFTACDLVHRITVFDDLSAALDKAKRIAGRVGQCIHWVSAGVQALLTWDHATGVNQLHPIFRDGATITQCVANEVPGPHTANLA